MRVQLTNLVDGQSRLNTRIDNMERRFDERFKQLEDHLDNQNYGIYNILEMVKSQQQQPLPNPWKQHLNDSSTKGEKGREETQEDDHIPVT